MIIHKETDLAQYATKWLNDNGWNDIYKEVLSKHSNRRADIVAIKNKVSCVVELKRVASFELLEQCAKWKLYSNIVYCFIPAKTTGWHVSIHRNGFEALASLWGIGIVTVDKYENIREVLSPKYNRLHRNFKEYCIANCCLEEHKNSLEAGSSGGGYVTPYKLSIECIRHHIELNDGQMSVDEMMKNIGHRLHWSMKSRKQSMIQAINNWEKEKFQFFKKDKKMWIKLKDNKNDL